MTIGYKMKTSVVLASLLLALSGCSILVHKPETPRVRSVEVAEGQWVSVKIYDQTCYKDWNGGYVWMTSPGGPAVYLCGYTQDEEHEIAHVRGMKHTAWERNGQIACATVLTGGYKTHYNQGERICMKTDTRFEWVEK